MLRRLWWVLLVPAVLAGCGRRESHPGNGQPLTLTELDRLRDTTGLSHGAAIVERFEPYRMANGLVRVRGDLHLPTGTVLQLSVSRAGEQWPITRVQFTLRGPHFDSPPILGANGPLPAGDYRFELTTFFDREWQTAEVLEATHDGRDLRGPGITRDRTGRAAFSHSEERRL